MVDTGKIIFLKETFSELELDWEIKEFFSLSERVYHSPRIYFSDALWYLRIYPSNLNEKVEIYLKRDDSGPRMSINRAFSIKTDTDNTESRFEGSSSYQASGMHESSWGYGNFISRRDLLERKLELVPSGVLTINCCLKQESPPDVGRLLVKKLLKNSSVMEQILKDGRRSDVVLKVGEQEFPAHKMILEAHSSVFAAMFRHDTEEERTGVVNITDVHPGGLKITLSYMYTGLTSDLNFRNVYHAYKAADKYNLSELIDTCKNFLEDYMCEDEVCNIIKLADTYDEKELSQNGKAYFKKHVKKVVKLESWKTFYKENQQLAMDLVTAVIEERVTD